MVEWWVWETGFRSSVSREEKGHSWLRGRLRLALLRFPSGFEDDPRQRGWLIWPHFHFSQTGRKYTVDCETNLELDWREMKLQFPLKKKWGSLLRVKRGYVRSWGHSRRCNAAFEKWNWNWGWETVWQMVKVQPRLSSFFLMEPAHSFALFAL